MRYCFLVLGVTLLLASCGVRGKAQIAPQPPVTYSPADDSWHVSKEVAVEQWRTWFDELGFAVERGGHVTGMRVAAFSEDVVLYRAGVRQWDTILQIDGKDIDSRQSMLEAIETLLASDTDQFEIKGLRNQTSHTITIRLQTHR